MDIFNELKISYKVESAKENYQTYSISIDGELILIENSNFSTIPLNKQLLIVKKFIDKDRLRHKIKEYFYIKWEEIETKRTTTCKRNNG